MCIFTYCHFLCFAPDLDQTLVPCTGVACGNVTDNRLVQLKATESESEAAFTHMYTPWLSLTSQLTTYNTVDHIVILYSMKGISVVLCLLSILGWCTISGVRFHTKAL